MGKSGWMHWQGGYASHIHSKTKGDRQNVLSTGVNSRIVKPMDADKRIRTLSEILK